MAIKSFLSEGGFSVGSVGSAPIEVIDSSGNITAVGLTVSGNLVVNGSTTTINSTTTTLDDPIFTLGGDTVPASDDNKDRGIEFRWHDGSLAKVGFFGFDDSTGKFVFIPNATNTSEVFSGTIGAIDLSGSLSGGTGINFNGSTGAITNTGVTSITGTSNQVTASASTGAITLSLPQNIHVEAQPTFSSLTAYNFYLRNNNTNYIDEGYGFRFHQPSGAHPVQFEKSIRIGAINASGTDYGSGNVYALGSGYFGSSTAATSTVIINAAQGAAQGGAFGIQGAGTWLTGLGTRAAIIGSGTDQSTMLQSYADNVFIHAVGSTKAVYLQINSTNKLTVDNTSTTVAGNLTVQGTGDSTVAGTLGIGGAAYYSAKFTVDGSSIGYSWGVTNTRGGHITTISNPDGGTTASNIAFRVNNSSGTTLLQSTYGGAVTIPSTLTVNGAEAAIYGADGYQLKLGYSSAYFWKIGRSSSGTLIFNDSATDQISFTNTGRLGIGIITPGAKLHVAGPHADEGADRAATTALIVDTKTDGTGDGKTYIKTGWVNTGNYGVSTLGVGYYASGSQVRDVITMLGTGRVGVGTTTPTQRLHLNGGVLRISGGGASSNGEINLDSGTEYDGWQVRKESSTMWGVKSVTSGNDLAIFVDNTTARGVYIKTGGNVGINQTNPQHKLDVGGAIRTTDWLYIENSNFGIYSNASTAYFSTSTNNWDISSGPGQTWSGLRLYSGGRGNTWRGHFYGDSTGQGFLDSGGNWQLIVDSSSRLRVYAGVYNMDQGIRVLNPGGAAYSTNSSTITGAWKIKLPTDRFKSNTMMRMTIKIYRYSTGTSTEFNVGGYNYSDAAANWYNVFAEQQSDLYQAAYTIRFGNDGTANCIWIGETNSTWDYPQVFVTDFEGGYSGTTQTWASGWSITPVTAFDTVTQSRTAAVQVNSNNIGNFGVNYITGTANQVLVNGGSGANVTGGVTLTLPQNIHTAATPTFGGGTLNGTLTVVKSNGGNVNGSANAAIYLSQDESSIQGPGANTVIRMGGNLVLGANSTWIAATNGTTAITVNNSQNTTLAGTLTVSGTGLSSIAGPLNVTGALLSHQTAAVNLAHEGSSLSQLVSYGADASTYGRFNIVLRKAGTGVSAISALTLTSTDATLAGNLTVSGTGTSSVGGAFNIGANCYVPNANFYRGKNAAGSSDYRLIGVTSGNVVSIDADATGATFGGNITVSGGSATVDSGSSGIVTVGYATALSSSNQGNSAIGVVGRNLRASSTNDDLLILKTNAAIGAQGVVFKTGTIELYAVSGSVTAGNVLSSGLAATFTTATSTIAGNLAVNGGTGTIDATSGTASATLNLVGRSSGTAKTASIASNSAGSLLLSAEGAGSALGIAANTGNTTVAYNLTVNGTGKQTLGQSVNATVYAGNTSTTDQAIILSNTRRANYGDVMIAKNLEGVASADSYSTPGTTAATGYAAVEMRYGGVVRVYGNSGATTAAAVVSPNTIAEFTPTAITLTPNTTVTGNLTVNGTGTINGTSIPASKTLVVTTDKLSVHAATTSAELAGVISDETGTGALVFANTPTLVTPNIGAATGTSVNLTGSGTFGTVAVSGLTRINSSPNAVLSFYNAGVSEWTIGQKTSAFVINNGGNFAGTDVVTISGSATSLSGNLTVGGNLIVNGTTTTVNSTTTTLDDPIITLGGDTAPTVDDNKDRGVEFKWYTGGAAKTGFFGFDDSTGYFTFIPDATNTSEVFSGTPGDIEAGVYRGTGANLTGPITESSTTDQAITLNATDNSWKYLGFQWSGTRKAYFGINASGSPEWGSDVANTTFAIVGSGSSLTIAGNTVLHAGNYNNYTDPIIQALDSKASVKAATTADITLSGTQTIDGVALVAGDRVLVKNQNTQTPNGIYVVSAGAWTRATDFDTWSKLIGAFVFVEQGSTNGLTGWLCAAAAGGAFGSNPIMFSQFSHGGSVNAGTGLTKTTNNVGSGPVSTFSITNTTVSPNSYGSASSVATFTVNAQGQLTAANSVAIAISSAAVSGLANSATITADSNNVANTIVLRDGSGNFNAGTITGTVTGGAGYLTGGDSNFYAYLYNGNSGDLNTYNQPGLYSSEYTGTTNNPTGTSNGGHWIQISDAGGTDVKTQWYFNNGGSDIHMRLQWGNGVWRSWRKLLHDGNYNSYAPTLTGTGASGTWGISITGNAATATTASNVNNGTLTLAVSGTGLSGSASFTANQSGNSTFTVTSNATSANAISTIVARDSNGDFNSRNITLTGSLNAVTKSFVIKHPTKEGKKLRYGSLEGPENGVYVRGKLKGSNVIELPDYWTKLVDPESITVQLTPIGSHQKLYIEKIEGNKVYIANENLLAKAINCFFYVLAERCDVEKLEVEIDA